MRELLAREGDLTQPRSGVALGLEPEFMWSTAQDLAPCDTTP